MGDRPRSAHRSDAPPTRSVGTPRRGPACEPGGGPPPRRPAGGGGGRGRLPVDDQQRAETGQLEVELTRERIVYEPRLVRGGHRLAGWGIETRVLKGRCPGPARLPRSSASSRPATSTCWSAATSSIWRWPCMTRRAEPAGSIPTRCPATALTVGKGATMLDGGRGRGGPAPTAGVGSAGGARARRRPVAQRRARSRVGTTAPSALGLEDDPAARLPAPGGGREAAGPEPARRGPVAGPRPTWTPRGSRAGPALGDRVGPGHRCAVGQQRARVAVRGVVARLGCGLSDHLARPGVAARGATGPAGGGGGVGGRAGRAPRAAERRMLVRATVRPAPGTWRTPSQRVGTLAQRAARAARRVPAIGPER